MYAHEEKCSLCGTTFLRRIYDAEIPSDKADVTKPLCPECRAKERERKEREREEREKEIRRKKAEEKRREFVKRLKAWRVVPIEDIRPEDDNVLYILGNGFDLMHGIESSYYDFRDCLGKHSSLRSALETYITVEDVWADFENALAHFDIEAMSSEDIVDMWLDIFDVYNEDSGAAEYYMAVEAAAQPIQTVATELPKRFRKWVNTLASNTADRPLKNMFTGGKVLDFNYTEFVEELYGVPKENVCYIHGCRVKQKGKPPEPLILGHLLEASDEGFEPKTRQKSRISRFRRAFVQTVRENVIDWISGYDEYLTKDTAKIIAAHEEFFAGLGKTDKVITVGHSFSETDRDYYSKVKSSLDDPSNARWYFGCYGLDDLLNLENLLEILEIDKSQVTVFCTDAVSVTPLQSDAKTAVKEVKEKPLCRSKDGKWTVLKKGNDLMIVDSATETVDYSATMPSGLKRAVFCANDSCLLTVMFGLDPGVLLFRKNEGHWALAGEFACNHQHLLVSRLCRVLVTDDDITFVYNNRIRKYSLLDGSLIYNKQKIGARNAHYVGKDITETFSR